MVAIIDLDSIVYAAAWPNKIPDGMGDYVREDGRLVYQDKTEDEISISIDSYMNNILTSSGATGYIAYIKGNNTGAHRYKVNPDYKSNRNKEKPKFWDFSKEYLENTWKAVSVDNIEVDDAVNITRLNIENSFIVAIDKDLLNLRGTHFNWKELKWVSNTTEQEYYYFWRDMIVGQPTDGLKGIPGKGIKYYEKLVDNNLPVETLPEIVIREYINHFGFDLGLDEFFKNYESLKILTHYPGFNIPDIIEYNKKEGNETT